jgi:hypothetical protein
MDMKCTVIGGGLSGLVAAVALAQQGRQVTLIEKRRELGGRAISTAMGPYIFNLGPHALYRAGALSQTLSRWGIVPSGGIPDLTNDSWLVYEGQRFNLPLRAADLWNSSLFSPLDKVMASGALVQIRAAIGVHNITAAHWLDRHATRPRVRQYLEMLFRLSTYCAAMDTLSAEALAAQLKISAEGVLYVDGGWQCLVRSLSELAQRLGVEIRTGETVSQIAAERVGAVLAAQPENTILALPPEEIAALAGVQLPPRIPVHMACLDLALDREPENAARFALGLDQPMYLSMHSRWARLAPEGSCVVQVGYYLRPGDEGSRSALESFCDVAMPGWRELVVHVRYLPQLIVTHAAPGLQLRAAIDCLARDSVFIAGDWVGPEGMLSDAAAASALTAASRLAQRAAGAS